MLGEHNPDFLRKIKQEELLPPISPWTTLGGLFLVGTCGAAVTLAAIIKYPISVKAPATVRPTGELRIVQAATEGIVKNISVKENQVVKKGEAIANIDNAQLQTKKSQLQGNLQRGNLLLTQINAQLAALNIQVVAESNLMNRNIASAQADRSRNQREYQNLQITSLASVQEAEAALELAREEMNRYQQFAKSGAIAQLQVKEKQQAFKAAVAKLKGAKAALNPTEASVEMATQKIAQERARGEATLATLKKEQQSLIQRRIETQNQISRDTIELQQMEKDLKKSVITAPDAGTILKLDLRNPGQIVRPGQPVAQIAPGKAPLVVKARVAAEDISKIRTCIAEAGSPLKGSLGAERPSTNVLDCGQGKVQMRISAYPYPDYGTLKGAVIAIAPDAITPQTSSAGAAGSIGVGAAAPYYEVIIQPEKPYLLKDGLQYPIQSGMEVKAEIISKEETVLTFILRKARLLANF